MPATDPDSVSIGATQLVPPELLERLPIAETLVAIATYNERRTLPSLVEVIRLVLPTVGILIIDDASPDGTGEWCREYGNGDPRLFLIERSGKLGLGTALTAAMRFAVDQGFRYLITMDADHSHPPALLPRMIAAVEGIEGMDPDALMENELESKKTGPEKASPVVDSPDAAKKNRLSVAALPDVVIGSRYCPGGSISGWSLRRHLMSRTINLYSRWILRIPARDCSGGYRCYRVEKLPPALEKPLLSEGYSFEEEILWRLCRRGARITELPIRFVNRVHGSSKLRLGGIFAAISVLLRMTFSRS